MDILEHARAIGRQIQIDDRYLALRAAQEASDADGDLQRLIGEFNLKRLAIDNEQAAEGRDDEKLARYNRELRVIYAEIMANDNMKAYEKARGELDSLLQRVMTIIQRSAQGDDPDTADQEATCSGDCSRCGGCH